MNHEPKTSKSVTVIIAAYNAGTTIARAVQSALNQPEVTEVIVVDDASSDDTIARAKAADDGTGRLKTIIQSKNGGPSAARNRAIAESRAEWIAVLDADDFFLPGRMKKLLTFADKADFIADDIAQADEINVDGPRRNLLGIRFGQARQVKFAEFVSSNVTDAKRERAELGFIKPIMRRRFLVDQNLSYKEHMRLGEDYELYARALALGARLYIVPTVGYVSVVRPSSLSGTHSEEDLMHFRNCDYGLQQIPGLTDADKKALRAHFLSVDCRLQWVLFICAMKKKDIIGAIKTFLRPLPVPFYVARKLCEHLVLRAKRKLKEVS